VSLLFELIDWLGEHAASAFTGVAGIAIIAVLVVLRLRGRLPRGSRGLVALGLAATVLIIAAIVLGFRQTPPPIPVAVPQPALASETTTATVTEDQTTRDYEADSPRKRARLESLNGLKIAMLIPDYEMSKRQRASLEGRFGCSYKACDVQRLEVDGKKGEAVLFEFSSPGEAANACAKAMSSPGATVPFVQVGSVVVEVYGDRSVVKLATDQLALLQQKNAKQ
jgi:hypothetical protein